MTGETACRDTAGNSIDTLATLLRLCLLPQLVGDQPTADDWAHARALSTMLVSTGQDKNLPPALRLLVFLPLLSSTEAIDHERARALFAGLRRETGDVLYERFHEMAGRLSTDAPNTDRDS